jgi:hypothetical protein
MGFKSQVTPNIGVSASASTITPTVSAGTTATLIGTSLANTGSTAITVSAKLNKSGGSSAFLVKDATVLPGGALVIVGGDQKVVLEAGDTVTAYSSVANQADAIVSYLV